MRLSALWAFIMIGLVACGGGGGASSTPTPTGNAVPKAAPSLTKIDTEKEGYLLLARGTFGARPGQAKGLVNSDATTWLQAQFRQPTTLYLNRLRARESGGQVLSKYAHTDLFWNAAIGANDQLRQRIVFALSQIMVVSDKDLRTNSMLPMALYMDALSKNAFGNYRDLLEDITYAPVTSEFLTYFRNRRADNFSPRMPDENYAREVMQLYSIGLVELQLNGQAKLGADGKPIETYTNDDVVGLAAVFTGMSLGGGDFWGKRTPDARSRKLVVYSQYHTLEEKTFLGLTIPAGTSGDESIAMALDHLYNHPNAGPFFARQMIQRLTQSDPSPAYIKRVAVAFNAGRFNAQNGTQFGGGQRGDMQAVIAAVLLDVTLWEANAGQKDSAGKVREPILLFTNWARAFNVSTIDAENEFRLRNTGDLTTSLAQDPFGAPSVFNYYRPGYQAPSTISGVRNLTVPEFQIMNANSFAGIDSEIHRFITESSGEVNSDINSLTPNYNQALSLADNPLALTNHLDILLTGGRLRAQSRDRIIEAIGEVAIGNNNPDRDRFDRVEIAIMMVVMSPAYAVLY